MVGGVFPLKCQGSWEERGYFSERELLKTEYL
jgi:hypothetical protein